MPQINIDIFTFNVNKDMIIILSEEQVPETFTTYVGEKIILSNNSFIEWYMYQNSYLDDDQLFFDDEVYECPMVIYGSKLKGHVQSQPMFCIYDSGDVDGNYNDRCIFYRPRYYDEEYYIETNNFTIWRSEHFYLLVVGQHARNDSYDDCPTFADCKVYLAEKLETLISYGLNGKQKEFARDVLFTEIANVFIFQ